MPLLRLSRLNDGGGELASPETIRINSDHIESVRGVKVCTLQMVSGQVWVVDIEPEALALAIDPEGACPDEPGECGYYGHYLAYGGPDLTHAGFHAAVAIHERHANTCSVAERTGQCSVCTAGELRIRA